MIQHLMWTWGPFLLAALTAIAIRVLSPRPVPRFGSRLSPLTVLAGLSPVLVMAALTAGATWPHPIAGIALGARATIPLVLGVLALCLLMVPDRSRFPTMAAAPLTRRSVMSFLRLRWIIASVTIVLVIGLLTIAAGLASVQDHLGRFAEYRIHLGTTGGSAAAGIYGWYHSVPAMLVLTVLAAVTVIGWLSIPRAAPTENPADGALIPTFRASNMGRIACGALLVHLSVVLQSLAGTAMMRASVHTAELGVVSAHTPFAALAPALWWSGRLALTAGLTLWILTALTALPRRARRLTAAAPRAEGLTRTDAELARRGSR